jgi:hypothetical protein
MKNKYPKLFEQPGMERDTSLNFDDEIYIKWGRM